MPSEIQNPYTIDYIDSLSNNERAELIDGVVYNMTPPTTSHQSISSNLVIDIGNFIRSNNGDCQVFHAPFAVYINDDTFNYVEPDIAVVCDKNRLDDKGRHGAPDFIIEIVSPSSRKMDYMIKLFKYRSAGVREYWIVDPSKKIVRTYDFINDDTIDYTFDDNIPVAIYPGFTLKIRY